MRVALAGAGMISAHHIPAWRTAGAQVVAVADPDLGRAQQRSAAFGIPGVFTDVAEMLDATRPDALDIASPRQTHAHLVRLAAERGLPVLCQKPLAPTFQDAEALVAEVGGRCRLMVHENWRFRPQYRLLKQWLGHGLLGEPTALSIHVRHSGFLPDASGRLPALLRQPFMADEERLMVAETLIHHIDLARWLMGEMALLGAALSRVSVACRGETAASLLFATTRDAPVVIEGHGACPGYPARGTDVLALIGTRGSADFADGRLQLRGAAPEVALFDEREAYQTSFDLCIRHFMDAVVNDRPFEASAEDNLETLRLVENAYQTHIH